MSFKSKTCNSATNTPKSTSQIITDLKLKFDFDFIFEKDELLHFRNKITHSLDEEYGDLLQNMVEIENTIKRE